MAGFFREAARRVFARELKDSNLTSKDESDQYAPQYLLTPTGAKVNRIFIVGTLIEKEDIGTDSEYWRGRVSDPTGSFLIYAGQYQPEAAQFLAECELPAFVAVIGKTSTYTTDDGNVLTSIRPESIQQVDELTRTLSRHSVVARRSRGARSSGVVRSPGLTKTWPREKALS